ncbi:scavenger receptor class F member 2-like [Ruditapes philippinarum]|uniref:scavenger receptor class F member 2-like n=1 Tax=Ruditapes philippinarum TaxID=129788 RepID=UPI00295BF076|nr:scavenger receptor class F member 2-like [Ruditapes philippinarum]
MTAILNPENAIKVVNQDGLERSATAIKCQALKFGTDCKEICSVNWIHGYCNNVNGNCMYGCKPGNQGDKCERKCEALKFGIECKESCSSNCKHGHCNNVNGNCTFGCKPGYQGNKCEKECNYGHYGDKCAHQCNVHCIKGNIICRHTDGECVNGCQAGWIGQRRDSKCMLGKFGQVVRIVNQIVKPMYVTTSMAIVLKVASQAFKETSAKKVSVSPSYGDADANETNKTETVTTGAATEAATEIAKVQIDAIENESHQYTDLSPDTKDEATYETIHE